MVCGNTKYFENRTLAANGAKRLECARSASLSAACLAHGTLEVSFGEKAARSARTPNASRQPAKGFTLIELILVMALLTVAVSVTAPALSNFFRGRTLDSEARRLLAMTRGGQNRAVSEGLPMDLWLDAANGKVGLEAEPSFEKEDSKRTEFDLDNGLTLEVVKQAVVIQSIVPMNPNQPISVASVPRVNLTHANLPTIRFLPDGTLSETSPEKIKLSGRDGSALWLVQAKDKLSYEIRNTDE